MKDHVNFLLAIYESASENNLKNLPKTLKTYSEKYNHPFKHLFEAAGQEFILETLGKHFITYNVAKLKTEFDISEQFIQARGFEINEGFVKLNNMKEDNHKIHEILQERMKQIINITEKVVSL